MKTTVLSAGAAVAGVSYALRQAREIEPRRVPLLGLAAAFVFAAQMLNFPIAGGTSGHVIGGVLAAVLLGPAGAVIVMTCVLVVQCLMFADGGLLALGANVFNMGIMSTCGGYLVFKLAQTVFRAQGSRGIIFAAAFAGWCGTVIGAISCAGQLALSNLVPWKVVFPAMANIHMIIGAGEGLATGLIVAAILRTRPELLAEADPGDRPSGKALFAYASLIVLGLAAFVAPFASPWPDGLERVAQMLGFEHQGNASSFGSAFPDYQVPFIGSPAVATAFAGLLGTAAAFCAAWLLAKVLVPVMGTAGKDATSGN